MKVSIEKITSAIGKISDLTSGDKSIPGVMLDLSENLLKVCYTDGHKSLIEKLEVATEDGDNLGQIVVDFVQLSRAISNCQPSGSIKVSDVKFEYKTEKRILTISVDQMFENRDAEGNIIEEKKMGNKKMDLLWTEPGADMKSAILLRMKYDDIFVTDSTPDEFDKKEFIEALSKTSVEKGKQIYISAKTQTMFVANQAHVTSVPISKLKTLEEVEINEIYGTVNEMGITDEVAKKEAIDKAIANAENRVHFSVAMHQNIAKALMGILSKTDSDKVYLHTKEKYCNIFIDNEDETLGIWFEMAQASKAHTGSLDRYASMQYGSYQTVFLKEFLDNNIKSALNASKSDKTSLKFEVIDGELGLTIAASSAAASVADTYRVGVTNLMDFKGDLQARTFNISLKVFSDMLAQLKTPIIAIDFEVGMDDNICLRASELDYSKFKENYEDARNKVKAMCEANGQVFDKNTTPTPDDMKLKFRDNTLSTKQYTMLGKQ